MNISQYSSGLLDFHNHSTYSDGGDTPNGLVKRAVKHDISAMALTDHHTNKGLLEFRKACKKHGILGIPFGMEISAELPERVLTPLDNVAPDLIILGRNANEEPVSDYQKIYFKDMKERHLPEVLKKLQKAGFKIPKVDLDEQCVSFHCPPDICHDFVNYGSNMDILKKYVKGCDSAVTDEEIDEKPIRFVNRWLYAVGMPAYTSRFKGFNIEDAVNLADSMNCKLFIAHPGGEYGFLSDKILEYYIDTGVHGIEVRNYFNSDEQNAKFDRLAKKHDLIRSGGSDCHGNNGPFKIGCYDRPYNQVPKDVLEELWYSLPS